MFTIQFTIALDTPMQIQCIAGVLLIIKTCLPWGRGYRSRFKGKGLNVVPEEIIMVPFLC